MDTASPSSSTVDRLTLGGYFEEQIATRLRRLAYELRHSRAQLDEERVHDLRVALRRLMETIRVARHLLPRDGTADVLDDLKKIMKAAGEVRGCDIAAGLLEQAGAPADATVLAALDVRRRQAADTLLERVQRAYERNATRKWRAALSPRSAGSGGPGTAT